MKYICQVCNKLVDEAFAVDGDGYYCSPDCYHENYTDDEPEETKEPMYEPITHEPYGISGSIDGRKRWWQR